MSTRYLKRFFKPRSILLIGDSSGTDPLPGRVLDNLLTGGFPGKLWQLSDQEKTQPEVDLHWRLDDLPSLPDLAIICSPANEIPRWVERLGKLGVKAAMILSRGLVARDQPVGEGALEQLRAATKHYGIRLLGPDCLGLLVPASKINASRSVVSIQPGKVAYIGQSTLLSTAMIDWANRQRIGFSHVLTLGEAVDVDLPSLIDYVAQDGRTQAILLQIDRVLGSARHLMSALRSAARNKLVLVLKSDIVFDDALKTALAPGVVNEDDIYDAAMRRAGVLRVSSSSQMFNALENLSRMRPLRGERLAIIGNGMGPMALAYHQLAQQQGQLASLSEKTIKALKGALPGDWRGENPLDLGISASPELFNRVLDTLCGDTQVDAVLVVHAPTAAADSYKTADAMIDTAQRVRRNVLTCWMGGELAEAARELCNSAGVMTFETPEQAVEAFMQRVSYRRNQIALRQTPGRFSPHSDPAQQAAEDLLAKVAAQGRECLHHDEVGQLLALYDIPVAHSRYAEDIEQVVAAAKAFDGSVAIKALHHQNAQPFNYDARAAQRWHDLSQDLFSEQEVRHAATSLAYRVSERYPELTQPRFCIQQMKRGFQSMQMNVGLTRDATFGPVIVFGAGGHLVDVLADRRLMLPPVNLAMARSLIEQSRIYSILKEHSENLDRDLDTISEIIVRLSQMQIELPQLKCLEINPLLLNKSGLLAIDATASIGQRAKLSISPYPGHLESRFTLRKTGQQVVIRPIRAEDEPQHLAFFNSLSGETIRLRYFYSRGVPEHDELASWTQIDYDREMAFIATCQDESGQWQTLGVVRAVTDPDNISSEFSVVIRDALQGEGLGRALMGRVIDYCRERGTLQIEGSTLPANKGMQKLAKQLGFSNQFNMEEEVVEMKLSLNEPTEQWQRTRLAG